MAKYDGETLQKAMLPMMLSKDCSRCYALGLDRIADLHYCKASGEFLPYWKMERGQKCPVEIKEALDG